MVLEVLSTLTSVYRKVRNSPDLIQIHGNKLRRNDCKMLIFVA